MGGAPGGLGNEEILVQGTKPKTPQRKAAPGRKPEVLKVQGNLKDAVKHSLKKKKPPEGWPK